MAFASARRRSGGSSNATGSPSKKSLHATEQGRPDVVAARRRFIVRQPALDPKHLIFLDETSATTKMTRTHGRCLRGQRLLEPVPHGHWKTSTLVAGLCLTGITAPYVMDGAMTGDVFLQYIKQILAPTLTSGDIVVMDNVATHKVAGIREAIEARHCCTCQPGSEPDREDLRQDQGHSAQDRRTHPRGSLASHRPRNR